MTKKALLIGGGIVVALTVAGMLAAQPMLERRAQASVDAFFDSVSRSNVAKVTHGKTRFDVWSRTLEIDDVTAESQAVANPFSLKADTLTIEGIGALKLLLGQVIGSSDARTPIDILKQVSATRIHVPRLDVETTPQGSTGTFKGTYKDAAISGLADGIAASFDVGGLEMDIPAIDKNVSGGTMTMGRLSYKNIDLALYASLYMPDAERGDDMRPLFTSQSAEPFTLVIRNAGNEALTFTFGASSSKAMRVKPSAINLHEIENLTSSLEQAASEHREPSKEELSRLFKALAAYFRGLDIEHFEIASLEVGSEQDESFAARTGAMTFDSMTDGRMKLFAISDIALKSDKGSIALRRYGFENVDFTGALRFLETFDGDAATAFSPSIGDVMRLMPRGSIFVEGLTVESPETNVTIGDYRLAVTGPSDSLLEGVSLTLDNFSIPVPEDNERTALLLDLGIEKLSGTSGLALSLDPKDKILKLDRLGIDMDKLGALNVTARTGVLDVEALDRAEDIEAATILLADLPLGEVQVKLENRDGGIDRLIASAASDQGLSADMLKQGLDRQIRMIAPIMLGDAADKVVPALSAFVKNPKSLTVTARPKDSSMSALAILIAGQMAPESLPELLDITAVAE